MPVWLESPRHRFSLAARLGGLPVDCRKRVAKSRRLPVGLSTSVTDIRSRLRPEALRHRSAHAEDPRNINLRRGCVPRRASARERRSRLPTCSHRVRVRSAGGRITATASSSSMRRITASETIAQDGPLESSTANATRRPRSTAAMRRPAWPSQRLPPSHRPRPFAHPAAEREAQSGRSGPSNRSQTRALARRSLHPLRRWKRTAPASAVWARIGVANPGSSNATITAESPVPYRALAAFWASSRCAVLASK